MDILEMLTAAIMARSAVVNAFSSTYILINRKKIELKVPKREIFDRSDFPDFYTIKSSWVGDLMVKILTYY